MRAVDRTWTGNLLITNQLLCQLSHNGEVWSWMTPTGFEPVLPPWKGGVLTTWPWSLVSLTASRSFWPPRAGLEPATTRLTAVRSTNWAIEDHFFLFFLFFPSIIPLMYLQNYIQNLSSNIFLTFSWLKPRPISNSQLHTLPYFHLCPIYLVVFKGSY